MRSFVEYIFSSVGFEAIDPAVANTITKLLFLSVENVFWQIRTFFIIKGSP